MTCVRSSADRMKFNPQAESLIADLRNVPYEKSPAKLGDMVVLENLVEVIFEKYKIGRASVEDTIMSQWRDIVGEQTAHRCRPHKIIDGRRLIIITNNAVLRQELEFRKRDILRKLRTLPQCENLRDLVLRSG